MYIKNIIKSNLIQPVVFQILLYNTNHSSNVFFLLHVKVIESYSYVKYRWNFKESEMYC